MIIVSAPGKVHLMGEHAVVYGKPALLAAINLRLSVSIQSADKGVSIRVDNDAACEFMRYAIDTVIKELRIEAFPACEIAVSSEIPFGYHLGSSAALAVATVGAAIYFSKKLWNPQEINRIAYEVEKKQHGNPSGGDNTAVTFGGLLWYRKELEFLKSMWQLPFRPAPEIHHFFLINTGKPTETTGEMVELVKQNVMSNKEAMEKVFAENEIQTKRITVALKQGDESEILYAIREGEKTLEEMGVVSTVVSQMIRKIEQAGGAAKILGGGGKKGSVGFVLCYHKQITKVQDIISPLGYSIQPIILGSEGIHLDRKE